MPFASVDQLQLQTYLNENMRTTGFVAAIGEKAANKLVITITFPVEFGAQSLLEVRTTPLSPTSVQVTLITQGVAPVTGSIRPSYAGYPSMLTYPIDGTADEIRNAYMSLRDTICPTRLTNPDPKNYIYFEDFETNQLISRTSQIPAFCGSYSQSRPYYFKLPTTIDLVRYPHLCFAVWGKLMDYVFFTYNGRGLNAQVDGATQYYPTNMSYAPANTWRFKCMNVLSALQKSTSGSSYTIFQLTGFYVIPRSDYWDQNSDYYIDSIYIGSEPIYADEQGEEKRSTSSAKLYRMNLT
ncbi:unnamed protein product [Echinostoma caproni]|uniref:Capsid protein n=1 Tax=Echinostoma caproni TaxID=27848 RepID=A0A183AA66_9TREM|nr:unnamed protein product [Echinostoma caproni]